MKTLTEGLEILCSASSIEGLQQKPLGIALPMIAEELSTLHDQVARLTEERDGLERALVADAINKQEHKDLLTRAEAAEKENAALTFQLARADKRLDRMLVAVRNLAGQRDEAKKENERLTGVMEVLAAVSGQPSHCNRCEEVWEIVNKETPK